jgi:hypothetical protein
VTILGHYHRNPTIREQGLDRSSFKMLDFQPFPCSFDFFQLALTRKPMPTRIRVSLRRWRIYLAGGQLVAYGPFSGVG